MRPLLVFALAAVAACGGKVEPAKQASVSVDAGAPAPAQTISKLPDAKLPPPLDFGSRLLERRPKPDWAPCGKSAVRDASPQKTIDGVGKACASVTALRPLGAPSLGKLSASSDAVAFPVHLDQGKCLRVVASAAPGVKALTVIVRDSTGRPAAIYKADDLDGAIAPAEALCFTGAADGSVSVSVGSGEGDYALQVWSD